MGNKRKLFGIKKHSNVKVTRAALKRQITEQPETAIKRRKIEHAKTSPVHETSISPNTEDIMENDIYSALIDDLQTCKIGNEIPVTEQLDTVSINSRGMIEQDIDEIEQDLHKTPSEDFNFIIEPNSTTSPPFVIEGRRIIDFNYFMDQIKAMSAHNPGLGCALSNMEITKEQLVGLQSVTHFKCNMCNQSFAINSCANHQEMTVSHAAVTGSILIGCGRTNLNELLTSMDLPTLNGRLYNKCHNDVSDWWATAAEHSMKEAAKEEAQIAAECGDTINGIPAITVVADACWSKRSYRTNYSAASGAAAIIGYKTGKVLHMAVKNKYCTICARSVAKNQSPPTHQCNRNHTGSSTSMEQVSIVEGFKTSVATHNLIYATLIADGDASTYKKILESRPYSNVQVQKIECSNHLLRNYCSKLMQLQKDTSIPLPERKLLPMEKITRLRTAVRAAARFRKAQHTNESEKIINLKNDILNSPKHVLGDHSACENYYCTEERRTEENLVPLAKTLFRKLSALASQMALNSKSLLYDVNNNRAEQFNSIVAKHVGGKRINFSLKKSYTARCHAAVVSFNTGKPLTCLYKTNFEKSPKKSIKDLELKRCERNRRRNRRPGIKKKIVFRSDKNDYGESCQKPDMTPEQYETAKDLFLQNLKDLVEKRHEVERDTILQAESTLWLELRRSLLTASSFSKVCKRRPNTNSAPLVKSLVYSYSLGNVAAVKYGKTNETVAIKQLEKQEGVNVQKCGLFIDSEHFFLGASPDGLFEEGIVEIKCPYSARNTTPDPEQAIIDKKIKFWKTDGTVNTNHDWYYQIQGQLHISQKNVCLFAVWTGAEFRLKSIKINKDDQFWTNNMEPKLIRFYQNCLLPELVDGRKSRTMPIRNILS
ncbi:LOW QUALITY PROTEIN: uncharacterized protein [Choristoneura fumiferana]|uniref:LOW QUALITY PROTEIN: uncharacterized protein n=1 Tax=Choristoneura fumiferana TaxID=7141 RepID=UPI003D15A132